MRKVLYNMNISVRKSVFIIASIYTIAASPRFSGEEKLNAAEYDNSFEIEITDEDGQTNDKTNDSESTQYDIEITDETDDDDDKNKEKKKKTKEKNNSTSGDPDINDTENDPSMLSSASVKSLTSFKVECYGCSDSRKKDGKIRIEITDFSEDDTYFFSFNGGKTFKQLSGRSAVFTGIGTGTYSMCAMKNNDLSTLSDVYSVMLYPYTEENVIDISAKVKNEKIYKDGRITVTVNNFDRKAYKASIDGGVSWTDLVGDSATFFYLNDGDYTVTVRPKSEISDEAAEIKVKITGVSHGSKRYIPADVLLQNPELPTGCEITSLTMLLNHIGYDVTKTDMADNYLPKGEYRNSDFNKVFVGNPRNKHAYGCFSQAITAAANSYIEKQGDSDKWKVRNITGCSLADLYTIIDKDHPVVVWGSVDMKEITAGQSWKDPETGKSLTWPAGEHCMLLVGYDISKGVVYVNDPMKGLAAYKSDIFEKRFTSLGSQAVIIVNS